MDIQIAKQSGIYTLTSRQILGVGIKEAWKFFSYPENLNKISPEDIGFQITNHPPDYTYPGQIITYKISIFPLIKNNWVTEITHCIEEKFFVDEQRYGPYAMWHHEHHFEEMPDGRVLMTDIVNFKLPLGIVGDLVAGSTVKQKVRSIFEGRFRILKELFPV